MAEPLCKSCINNQKSYEQHGNKFEELDVCIFSKIIFPLARTCPDYESAGFEEDDT